MPILCFLVEPAQLGKEATLFVSNKSGARPAEAVVTIAGEAAA